MSESLNILLIGGDKTDEAAIHRSLEEAGVSAEIEGAPDRKSGQEKLRSKSYSCALLDEHLRDGEGIDFLRVIRRTGDCLIPVIFLSAEDKEGIERRAMAEGAQECLVKGALAGPDLARSIHRAIERHRHRTNFRRLIETNADGVLIVAHTGLVVYANDAASTLLGHPRGQVVGKPFVKPPDAGARGEVLLQGKRIGELRESDVEWDGGSARMITLRDITERKQAEDKIRRSERWQSLVLDATHEGIWDWNIRTGEVYFSPRWIESLGYSPEEVEPHVNFWLGILHPDDIPGMKAALTDHLEGRTLQYECENRLRMKSGEYRWNLDRGKVVERAPDGTPLRMVGSDSDITDRKLSELEIRELNTKLEARVLQRTLQLESANQELEAFSYSVSHDLRAPLRHVHGFVGLLRKHSEQALDEKGRRYLSTIADSTVRMGQLIDELLSFSRTSRAELRKSLVSQDQLVRGILSELQPDLEGRRVTWEIGPLPDVEGDPALLRQVWVNLLSNALKYTRPRAESKISLGVGSANGHAGVMFVRDNGVGFDMKYANKLFGVFQRLHGESEFEGTGIGLALTARILHRHGGEIWAEGKVDEGATFYFTLPRDLADSREKAGTP